MDQKERHIGMAWFRRYDYKEMRSKFSDGHRLPDSYDKWLQMAASSYNKLISRGVSVEKVYIDPVAFPAWCRLRGLDIDANSRVQFANEFAGRKYLAPMASRRPGQTGNPGDPHGGKQG